ncbi:MAG: ATP-binding cassette domain-containing protein [Trueperaceae bacterium]|nr:MAG: ATP-binding cassette domain-containing protein [Trueperaceae bacterium]
MIRAEHLSKIFGPNPTSALELLEQGQSKDHIRESSGHVVGVNDVSFRLKRGEFFVIMGLSGSGKSTLLRCLNRLIPPTAGRVVLETDEGEIDVGAASARQLRDIRTRHLTMVFQRFGLLPHRSVRDNVAYGLEIQGVDRGQRIERADRALDLVGLGGWGPSRTSELSGGMQQRVGLARALATEAEVMLMDEPFSALDPLIKMQMQQEIIKLQNDLGKTIVFITHDLDEALRLGDRIAIMEDGRVVQLGTPERILTNPATAYVADFVEHADPTHVITARTVSVELDHDRVDELRREAGGRVIVHRTQADVEIVIDADDRVREVRADGGRAELVPIDTLLAEEAPTSRYRDRAAVVRADRPLRTLLEARNLCNLPVLVIDHDERLIGLVTEREIIYSIIEKRGRDAMNGDDVEAAA